MDRVVNLRLLTNPLNWLIVMVMVWIGVFLLAMISPQSDQVT